MILAKLKESTKAQHDHLEGVVDVMNKMFTREDYQKLLTNFYRFYSAMESAVAANDMSANGIDIDRRRKVALLKNDLRALGVSDAAETAAADKPKIPVLDTPAKAYGAMYVMEGATLGGQVITRHLKQHLDLTPENGGSFFNSYGAEVGPMWKDFGAAITAFAESHNNDDEIVDAAKETFDSFAALFDNTASAAS